MYKKTKRTPHFSQNINADKSSQCAIQTYPKLSVVLIHYPSFTKKKKKIIVEKPLIYLRPQIFKGTVQNL